MTADELIALGALRAEVQARVREVLDPPPSPLFMDVVVADLARSPMVAGCVVSGGHALDALPEREPGDDDPDEGETLTVGEFLEAIRFLKGAA